MANENKEKDKVKEKPDKPKGNSSNIIIIILLILILVLVAGFVVYSLFFNKTSKTSNASNITQITPTTDSSISAYTYDMKEQFLGNLTEENGKKSYIQAKISFGYNTKDAAKMTKELTDKTSESRDIIYSILLTKKASDLNSTAGRDAAKKEIIDKLKTVYTDGQVNNIYFYDIVIQTT